MKGRWRQWNWVSESLFPSAVISPLIRFLVKELQPRSNENNPTISFDATAVIKPSLADVHIMFCRSSPPPISYLSRLISPCRALPIISRLVEDTDSDIRANVVSMCGEFCIWMGAKWSAILLDVMFCCFRDVVVEVRAAALTAVPHAVAALLYAAIKAAHGRGMEQEASKPLQSLIAALCSMTKDTSIAVRVTLCTAISRVMGYVFAVSTNGHLSQPFLETILRNLCDSIVQLLEDKSSEVPRQMVVELSSSVEKEFQHGESSYISMLFTPQNSPSLLRSLSQLSKQTSWRVRKLVSSVIPKLVTVMTTVQGRSTVSSIITPLLYDPVFEVRRSAARALCLAAGAESQSLNSLRSTQDEERTWLDHVVLPQLESLRTSRVYSNRILALHMIATMIVEDVVHEGDVRYNILFNVALTLSRDPVPNVRIALCEVMGVIGPLVRVVGGVDRTTTNGLNMELLQNATRTLELMSSDSDKDVSYFASKAKEYMETNGAGGYSKLPSLFQRRSEMC
jgi:hypothetical protein